jgi:hypothetical protein
MVNSRFNGVLSASKVLTDHFAKRGLQAYYFPQFADTNIYRRHELGGTGSSFDCIYVGNNIKGESVNRRGIYPIAEFCVREGLRFGLFGAGWRSAEEWRLLSPFIRGPVPAMRVPALYSETKVVLNIHFPSHRRFGIFTSRVYEGLACEAFIVSDSVLDSGEIPKTAALWTSEPDGLVGGIARCLEMSPAKADEIRRQDELSYRTSIPRRPGRKQSKGLLRRIPERMIGRVQPASWSVAGILAFSKRLCPDRFSNGDRGRAIVSNPDSAQPFRRIQKRWGIGRGAQFLQI